MGTQIYPSSVKKDTPITVLAAAPVLTAAKAPVVAQPSVGVWAMSSDTIPFGWLTERNSKSGDRSFSLADSGQGTRHVELYDPWTGQSAGEADVTAADGRLRLNPPASSRQDIAFKITIE